MAWFLSNKIKSWIEVSCGCKACRYDSQPPCQLNTAGCRLASSSTFQPAQTSACIHRLLPNPCFASFLFLAVNTTISLTVFLILPLAPSYCLRLPCFNCLHRETEILRHLPRFNQLPIRNGRPLSAKLPSDQSLELPSQNMQTHVDLTLLAPSRLSTCDFSVNCLAGSICNV